MGVVKQINIKNRTYYFYNDIVDIKNFNARLLEVDKKSFKDVGTYNIGYIAIKKIDDCKNVSSVSHLYLLIVHANRYTEKEYASKYLVFNSTDENKEVLKKFNDTCKNTTPKVESFVPVEGFYIV